MLKANINIDEYKIKIFKMNKLIYIKINDLKYKLDINIFNFFVFNILNSINEYEIIMKNKKDGFILNNEYKNLKYCCVFNNIFDIKLSKNISEFNFSINIDEVGVIKRNLYDLMNQIYNFEYSINNIDIMFLAKFFWRRLEFINGCKFEMINLDDLYVFNNGHKRKLNETVYYNFLKGDKNLIIPDKFNTNHINESSIDRINNSLESIKKNGYPYNNQYIILYDESNEIRDGQHRACCIRYLNGNIKVEVCIFFIDYKKYNEEIREKDIL